VPNIALDIPALMALIQPLIASQIPAGLIAQWKGSIATIPAGWALCDGTAGTPNLLDKFVIGAGGALAVDATGGSATHDHGAVTGDHTLTVSEIPEHFHYLFANGVQATILPAAPEGSVPWSNGNSPGEEEYEMATTALPAAMGRSSLAGGDGLGGVTAHSHAITAATSLPPYYALAYIMKT
jgi:microcystin-dependent protein